MKKKIIYIAHYDENEKPLGKDDFLKVRFVRIETSELQDKESIENLPTFSRWIPSWSFSEQFWFKNKLFDMMLSQK